MHNKKISLRITGNSMLPLIKNGDEIEIKKINSAQELKRFDIVLFKTGNDYVCHFFWKKNGLFNESKANPTLIHRALNPLTAFDSPVPYDSIIGVVTNYYIPWSLKVRIYLFTILFSKNN